MIQIKSYHFKIAVITILSLFAVSPGWALSLSDVVNKVESNYKKIVAFKGSFDQAVTLKTLNKTQKGEGELFYKKPNKIKWQYKSPSEQEIISDGKTLWMYLPENRQVYIYDLTDSSSPETANEGQIPGNFLTSLGDLNRDFNLKWGTPKDRDAKGNFIIELVPKRPVVNIRNIFIVVPREIMTAASTLFPVLASTVYDSYGNITNLDFIDKNGTSSIEILEISDQKDSAKKRVGTLPDTLFTFIPPANVEIINPALTGPK